MTAIKQNEIDSQFQDNSVLNYRLTELGHQILEQVTTALSNKQKPLNESGLKINYSVRK